MPLSNSVNDPFIPELAAIRNRLSYLASTIPPSDPYAFSLKILLTVLLTLLPSIIYTHASTTFSILAIFATLLTSLWVTTKPASRPWLLCAYATMNTHSFPRLTHVSMDAFVYASNWPLAEKILSTRLY